LVNMLPYLDVITQRGGFTPDGIKHNNIVQRITDAGPLMALSSVFTTAYVPQKEQSTWYDADFNRLGSLKTNYYAKRYYTNPYMSGNPRFTLSRMSRPSNRSKSIYSTTKQTQLRNKQFGSLRTGTLTKSVLRNRLRDYNYY